MVNEEKVKLMNRMALYEEKQGKEDFKISAYYKKDYSSYQTIVTLIWATIGYVLLMGMLAVAFLDTFLEKAGILAIVFLTMAAIALYVVLLVSYGLFASRYYQKKYTRARGRVKRYIRLLVQLERFYNNERKKKYE